jgi:hypothetical protein
MVRFKLAEHAAQMGRCCCSTPLARIYTRLVRSHKWVDRRSLALHEAVAAKLEGEPGLLDVARSNLRRWLQDRAEPALDEWRDLIARTPLDGIVTLLRSSTPTAARLRQSSPFAGILTPEERQAILNRYEPRRA